MLRQANVLVGDIMRMLKLVLACAILLFGWHLIFYAERTFIGCSVAILGMYFLISALFFTPSSGLKRRRRGSSGDIEYESNSWFESSFSGDSSGGGGD